MKLTNKLFVVVCLALSSNAYADKIDFQFEEIKSVAEGSRGLTVVGVTKNGATERVVFRYASKNKNAISPQVERCLSLAKKALSRTDKIKFDLRAKEATLLRNEYYTVLATSEEVKCKLRALN